MIDEILPQLPNAGSRCSCGENSDQKPTPDASCYSAGQVTQRTASEFCLESPKTRKILTGLVHFGPFWIISPGDTRIQRDGLCLTTCFGRLTKSCLIGRKQFGGCTQNIVGCTECACDRLVAMMRASWQLMTGRSTDGSPTKHGRVFERQESQMYPPNKCSQVFCAPNRE